MGYDEAQTGAYNVLLSFEENTNPLEPNDNMADAAVFPVETGRLATQFFPQNDIDWFKLPLPGTPGDRLKITIETHGNLDPEIFLHDSDGESLATDDDGGNNYNALLTANVSAGTSYYLKIHEIDNLTGDYSIEVSIEKGQ
jgi:hypothetical protein